MRATWAFLALLGLLVGQAAAQGCDCSKLRLSKTDTPVCDQDGAPYASKCLALCQGVKAPQPCPGARGKSGADVLPFAAKHLDTRAVLKASDLTQFKKEGFVLSGKIRLSKSKAWMPGAVKRPGGGAVSRSATPLVAARVTASGLVYTQSAKAGAAMSKSAAAANGGKRFVAGSRGSAPTHAGPHARHANNANATNAGNRKLSAIFGPDNRVQVVEAAHNHPLRTVGHVRQGCSGALIGPATVLTAGHCVYDTASRNFYSNYNFLAARHTHCLWNMWGWCWQWEAEREVGAKWVTTFFSNAGSPVQCSDGSFRCQTERDFSFDIAVIQLHERVGDQFGWLGFGYSWSSQSWPITTAGYPGDKDNTQRTMWTTTGTLNAFNGLGEWWDVPQQYVWTDTDGAGGQSGSAMWSSDLWIRGILVSSGTGVKTITKFYYDWILANRI